MKKLLSKNISVQFTKQPMAASAVSLYKPLMHVRSNSICLGLILPAVISLFLYTIRYTIL